MENFFSFHIVTKVEQGTHTFAAGDELAGK